MYTHNWAFKWQRKAVVLLENAACFQPVPPSLNWGSIWKPPGKIFPWYPFCSQGVQVRELDWTCTETTVEGTYDHHCIINTAVSRWDRLALTSHSLWPGASSEMVRPWVKCSDPQGWVQSRLRQTEEAQGLFVNWLRSYTDFTTGTGKRPSLVWIWAMSLGAMSLPPGPESAQTYTHVHHHRSIYTCIESTHMQENTNLNMLPLQNCVHCTQMHMC